MKPTLKAGLTLVEVLLALFIFSVLGLASMQLCQCSMRSLARASELQMGTLLAEKSMDAIAGKGYGPLSAAVGQIFSVDLASLGEPGDNVQPDPQALVADGVRYSCFVAVSESRPGLLSLELTLHWEHLDAKSTGRAASIEMVRFLANPVRALESE